jgi:hypothetical protein
MLRSAVSALAAERSAGRVAVLAIGASVLLSGLQGALVVATVLGLLSRVWSSAGVDESGG